MNFCFLYRNVYLYLMYLLPIPINKNCSPDSCNCSSSSPFVFQTFFCCNTCYLITVANLGQLFTFLLYVVLLLPQVLVFLYSVLTASLGSFLRTVTFFITTSFTTFQFKLCLKIQGLNMGFLQSSH